MRGLTATIEVIYDWQAFIKFPKWIDAEKSLKEAETNLSNNELTCLIKFKTDSISRQRATSERSPV